MFIITCLYWNGLFTKKELILSLSCVSVTIIVSLLDIRQFLEVKTSTSVPPNSSIWWLLFFCWKVITLLNLSCIVFSYAFVSVTLISVICSVLYIFSCLSGSGRVFDTRVFCFTYWYPVFFKTFESSENSCMDLKAHSQTWENFYNWKPFKNDENCFSFHLKSCFCSQDIKVFVLTFWSCRKTTWLET